MGMTGPVDSPKVTPYKPANMTRSNPVHLGPAPRVRMDIKVLFKPIIPIRDDTIDLQP